MDSTGGAGEIRVELVNATARRKLWVEVQYDNLLPRIVATAPSGPWLPNSDGAETVWRDKADAYTSVSKKGDGRYLYVYLFQGGSGTESFRRVPIDPFDKSHRQTRIIADESIGTIDIRVERGNQVRRIKKKEPVWMRWLVFGVSVAVILALGAGVGYALWSGRRGRVGGTYGSGGSGESNFYDYE